ncbi:MAG: redox-sensing transcriptional repressor Rex [Phycisphaerae bacterium]
MTLTTPLLYSPRIMASEASAAGSRHDPQDHPAWDGIPAPAVRRLCLYLRELEGLLARGRLTVSSKDLGRTLGYTDAQVRKDLAYFGHFGQPGIGYGVEELITRIRGILGTDKIWNVVVVGAGNIGQALSTYRGFLKRGFRIVGVFDNNPAKVGQRIGDSRGIEILPLDCLSQVVASQEVQLGILAVPAEAAQEVAEALLAAGVKGILNFAPASLAVPEPVPVVPVELSLQLEQLAFQIRARSTRARAR